MQNQERELHFNKERETTSFILCFHWYNYISNISQKKDMKNFQVRKK